MGTWGQGRGWVTKTTVWWEQLSLVQHMQLLCKEKEVATLPMTKKKQQKKKNKQTWFRCYLVLMTGLMASCAVVQSRGLQPTRDGAGSAEKGHSWADTDQVLQYQGAGTQPTQRCTDHWWLLLQLCLQTSESPFHLSASNNPCSNTVIFGTSRCRVKEVVKYVSPFPASPSAPALWQCQGQRAAAHFCPQVNCLSCSVSGWR